MRSFLNFAVDIGTIVVLGSMLKTALVTKDDAKGEKVTFALIVLVINMLLRFIF